MPELTVSYAIQRRRVNAVLKKVRTAKVRAAIKAAKKAADGDSGDEEHDRFMELIKVVEEYLREGDP